MLPQVVLKESIINDIAKDPEYAKEVAEHKKNYPRDPLPIPFDDPEPQLMMGYQGDKTFPYHVQIHRDAFSYGDIGPRSDPRVIVDLRFFGKQDISDGNYVEFPQDVQNPTTGKWEPGVTDDYGMPQPTVCLERNSSTVTFITHDEPHSSTSKDLLMMVIATKSLYTYPTLSFQESLKHFTRMMKDMAEVALTIGPFLPGSYPQFMVGLTSRSSSGLNIYLRCA